MNKKSMSLALAAAMIAACSAQSGENAVGHASQGVTSGAIYNFGTLANPGSCMDAQSSGTGGGTQIQEWVCNGTGAQSYALQDAGGGAFYLVNTNANKCVDVSARGMANGTKIQLWDCNQSVAQSFNVVPQSNGFVTFVNTNSGKCLDVAADNGANGTVVQLYDCNGTNAQLWNPAVIGSTSGSSSGGSSGSSGGSSCDPNAWVYMGTDANACDGHIGESCGWTTENESQGYHCATTSWGTGCEPGGSTCPAGGGSSSGSSSGSSGGSSSGSSSGSGGTGNAGASLVFSPYKDTGINMNWNTNVISTTLSGAATSLAGDLAQNGATTVSLAFATGECGSENWGGVAGAAMASANVPLLTAAGVKYIVSTGGAAGSFTCGSDSGMSTFLSRWSSSDLIGVDFDIEAGQSAAVIGDLVQRIRTAHGSYPTLRFSLTLGTLANNNGASSAQSLGSGLADSFNVYGDESLAAVKSTLGFNGSPSSWPGYLTVNLMTMDYGGASSGVCVVNSGVCDMGQSAIQAAYNLRDHWGVPLSNIELTPMLGGNDVSSEQFSLQNADTVSSFAIGNKLAGVHYWSYDRDTDCAAGSASATCNSMGNGYAGAHGYLKRFLGDGLH